MTAPTPTEHDLAAALAGLGDTPEAVAVRLHSAGARGLKCSPWNCPLADWLRRRWPGTSFAVWPGGPERDEPAPGGATVKADLAGPVAAFVRAFDTTNRFNALWGWRPPAAAIGPAGAPIGEPGAAGATGGPP